MARTKKVENVTIESSIPIPTHIQSPIADSEDSDIESPESTSIYLVRIPELSDKPTYRISEVARYYSRTPRTIYEWIRRGLLETVMTPRGGRMITRESLDKARFVNRDKI
jgi:excisionase family DNA binding protein